MNTPEAVPHEKWLTARKELLAAEKRLTHVRDEVNTMRRELPMVKIDKPYALEGPGGRVGLADLFEGRRQLIVYHFMFDPSWDEGCKSCSFTVDGIGHRAHLHARDTTLALVSRAPLTKLTAYRTRMGWTVPWYSSYGSDFNYDFHVTLDDQVAPVEYNTYSAYARGTDLLTGTYNWLDLTPYGRQEDWERPPGRGDSPFMSWLRRHDEYDD